MNELEEDIVVDTDEELSATPITKKKSKPKPKQDPEEKQFVQQCKLLFSSLSSRATQFAYFNVAKNTIILANSTTPDAEEHGDRFMDYSVGELSLHILECKDQEFYQKLVNFLGVPDGVYFCVHIVNFLSLLGKFAMKELDRFIDTQGYTIIVNKGRTTYDKKNIIGWQLINFHVIKEIYQWHQSIMYIGSEEHKQQVSYLQFPVDTQPVIVGRVFFIDLHVDLYRDKNNVPVFRDMNPTVKLLCLDGLTVPSLKEFIKKVSDKPFTFELFTWVVDNSYILSMTLFENEMVRVRTIRPNILAIPVPKCNVTDSTLLMSLSEDVCQ